jgi:hypothetical protein
MLRASRAATVGSAAWSRGLGRVMRGAFVRGEETWSTVASDGSEHEARTRREQRISDRVRVTVVAGRGGQVRSCCAAQLRMADC